MEDFIQQTLIKLDMNGFDIESENEISYGFQFHISGGAILNIYQNKKGKRSVVIQGRENERLNKIFK